jgi:hypothetical protein
LIFVSVSSLIFNSPSIDSIHLTVSSEMSAASANLLANRAYGWSNVMGNIGHLQWCALAQALWAAWAWSDWQSRAAQFTALHIGLACSPASRNGSGMALAATPSST